MGLETRSASETVPDAGERSSGACSETGEERTGRGSGPREGGGTPRGERQSCLAGVWGWKETVSSCRSSGACGPGPTQERLGRRSQTRITCSCETCSFYFVSPRPHFTPAAWGPAPGQPASQGSSPGSPVASADEPTEGSGAWECRKEGKGEWGRGRGRQSPGGCC